MYIYMEKKFGHYGYIFLILFLYIFDFIMRDYSWVKLKFLMDAKSIPVFKIMLSIGIIGCLLVIICFIIVSNAPCNIIENITKIDNKYLYKGTNKEIDFFMTENETENDTSSDLQEVKDDIEEARVPVTPMQLDRLADKLVPRIKRLMRAEMERSVFR